MSRLIDFIITIPILIFSLTLHEIAHGLAAMAMGDKTARASGRLSFNPIKHIDWFGFVLLLVAGVGWAKPVPVNMFRFKDPKKGMAITALAGPLTNILLVFVSLIFLCLGLVYGFNPYVMSALRTMVYYNAVIAMFNFLPIPPLDGSKIFFAFLPDKYYYKLMFYERYGMILILALSYTNMTSRIISVGVNNLISKLSQVVINLFTLLGV